VSAKSKFPKTKTAGNVQGHERRAYEEER